MPAVSRRPRRPSRCLEASSPDLLVKLVPRGKPDSLSEAGQGIGPQSHPIRRSSREFYLCLRNNVHARQTCRRGARLCFGKSAIVLGLGSSFFNSHINSTFRWVSCSKRRPARRR